MINYSSYAIRWLKVGLGVRRAKKISLLILSRVRVSVRSIGRRVDKSQRRGGLFRCVPAVELRQPARPSLG